MRQTAKLFMNGRSQAVRLPADFRFEGDEGYIYQDPKTLDIILSKKPHSWKTFFKLADEIDIPSDFMKHCDKRSGGRDIF